MWHDAHCDVIVMVCYSPGFLCCQTISSPGVENVRWVDSRANMSTVCPSPVTRNDIKYQYIYMFFFLQKVGEQKPNSNVEALLSLWLKQSSWNLDIFNLILKWNIPTFKKRHVCLKIRCLHGNLLKLKLGNVCYGPSLCSAIGSFGVKFTWVIVNYTIETKFGEILINTNGIRLKRMQLKSTY